MLTPLREAAQLVGVDVARTAILFCLLMTVSGTLLDEQWTLSTEPAAANRLSDALAPAGEARRVAGGAVQVADAVTASAVVVTAAKAHLAKPPAATP